MNDYLLNDYLFFKISNILFFAFKLFKIDFKYQMWYALNVKFIWKIKILIKEIDNKLIYYCILLNYISKRMQLCDFNEWRKHDVKS